MELDMIKRGLRAEIKKREKETYATCQTNVRDMCTDVLSKLEEQEKEIAELKERDRKTQRALWLARANRVLEKIAWLKLWNANISTMNPEDGARQEYDKWKKAFGKCLAKAKEYE